MLGQIFRHRTVLFVAVASLLLSQSIVSGQAPPDPNTPSFGGIEIDAQGVLTQRAMVDNAGLLNRQRVLAAQTTLNKDLQTPSKLRKISLTRLEAEVKKRIDSNQPIPADMQFLAGMNRITHVFYYPDSQDIVIAGPAEGYFISADNRVIGMHSGQATLLLQDLIVALRAFAPNQESGRIISCSIDPTREGVQKMQQAVNYISNNFQAGNDAAVVQLLRQSLGLQVITIQGVSTKTHFARVLVEADYHMKLIGIGLEQPPVRLTTFIEKSTPTSIGKNALARWFFQPNYDCVTLSDDGLAMQLTGSGVKLVGEDESVTRDGQRKNSKGVNAASRAYCTSFTKMYDRMAERSPLWGELRNLMDISIASAFIQKAGLFEEANWKMDVFGDESKYPVEKFSSPTHVAPVANAVWKGNYLMTPIAGGVSIQPRVALNSDRVKQDDDGKIASARSESETKLGALADGQWWWD